MPPCFINTLEVLLIMQNGKIILDIHIHPPKKENKRKKIRSETSWSAAGSPSVVKQLAALSHIGLLGAEWWSHFLWDFHFCATHLDLQHAFLVSA